ncbi:MAG TPA: succinate-semialdehyde dehydrogenase (NADP(+)) [Actinobacteria bacterium]|jgi:succinate-semialdehyde dehydrogenase/glutarate-semialdehyde dehydrogenase|nr:succinate-semialdehyde dehydrogenase (NADP(+)) [Actinomycetota bacterium]
MIYGNYIAGEWQDPGASGTFPVINPATGEVIAEVACATADDIRRAIDGADAARAAWAATPAIERSVVMRRAAQIMMDRIDELAAILVKEQGKPLAQAKGEITYGCGFIDWFAEEGRRAYGTTIPASVPDKRIVIIRQPIGISVAITPWNFPSLQLLRKLGAALGAGCPMIAKPAELTPLSALEIARAFDEAGLPKGLLSVVCAPEPYEFTDVIMADPRVRAVSFTGSTEVGKLLMRRGADHVKKVSLELGGQAPTIVFEDADLDAVVVETMASKFRNMGQTCVSVNRIYVHESIIDELADRLKAAMAQMPIGDGLEPDTAVGPLVEPAALEKVQRHVDDAVAKGARVVVGGNRATAAHLKSDQFFEPTLLVGVDESMQVMQEETFGPVAPLVPFTDEADVVARANGTPFGLSAYVFTRDINRAIRVSEALEFGTVGINDSTFSAVQAPFGGYKESGLGREGGFLGLDEFMEYKFISIGHVG